MKVSYASKIELCEIHYAAIINKLSFSYETKDIEHLKELVAVVLQPHDKDYQIKISNSGNALLINRVDEFANKLNVEKDFILIK